jgi:hypothetical protein
MKNEKYPWHSEHSEELQKKNRERYKELKSKRLCVLCGQNSAVLSSLDGACPAKFLKYCEQCRENHNLNRSETRLRNKIEVLAHYGKNRKLQCFWPGCEITDPDMLSLDHKDNTGNEDRKKSKGNGGVMLYAKLKRQGYPEGFQTLCHNHQWKKEILRRRSDINGIPTWRK